MLAAYAALLPAGKRQGDEYLGTWFVAQRGWRMILDRIAGWRPRPLSEVISWLYLTSSNAFDRPLIAPFLACVWLAALAAIAATGRVGRLRAPTALAVVWFALALLLARPGEMFIWPMGAAAYVPCWATLAAALCLFAAALSVEIGALNVVIYAGLAAIAFLRDAHRLRPLAAPALGGIAVCVIVLHGRMQGMGEVMDAGSGLAGNWPASLRPAVPTFAREAAGIEGLPLLAGAAAKLALVVCLSGDRNLTSTARRQATLWACALLFAAFASVVLAYHQFGALCCGQHATLRQGMTLLAVATLASLLRGVPLPLRQVGLAAVLLGLLAARRVSLSAEWRAMPGVVAARARHGLRDLAQAKP